MGSAGSCSASTACPGEEQRETTQVRVHGQTNALPPWVYATSARARHSGRRRGNALAALSCRRECRQKHTRTLPISSWSTLNFFSGATPSISAISSAVGGLSFLGILHRWDAPPTNTTALHEVAHSRQRLRRDTEPKAWTQRAPSDSDRFVLWFGTVWMIGDRGAMS